jgi:MFS family permease
MYLAGTLILGLGFQAGQFLGYPMWGRAVDRFGRKPVLFISSVVHTAGWLWWIFLTPAMLPWLFLTQFLGGFMFGGQDIASFNMMLRFNRKGGPGYQAVASVIFSIVGATATLASGAFAEFIKDVTFTFGAGTPYEYTFRHYAILIVVGASIKFLGDLVVLPMVHDVTGSSRTHALRFVFQNAYGNLNTVIFTPLRTGARVSANLAGRSLDTMRDAVVDVADAASDVADAASERVKKFWR